MTSGGDNDGANPRFTTYGTGTKAGAANALNQYPAIANPGSYDITGNLTTDTRWTYTWNAEPRRLAGAEIDSRLRVGRDERGARASQNRLTQMETNISAASAGIPKQKLQFTYDHLGRRINKRVHSWNWTSGAYPATPAFHQKYN